MSDTKAILKIEDLTVSIQEKKIIDKLNIEVLPGQVHAIMGKNGSGKSTLGKVYLDIPIIILIVVIFILKINLSMKKNLMKLPGKEFFLGFNIRLKFLGLQILRF